MTCSVPYSTPWFQGYHIETFTGCDLPYRTYWRDSDGFDWLECESRELSDAWDYISENWDRKGRKDIGVKQHPADIG